MSPSPFSETRIGVTAGVVAMARWDGLVHRKATRVESMAYGPSSIDDHLLHQLLDHLPTVHEPRMPIRLVLGAPLNRYLLLRKSPALAREADWMNFARARAAQVYGGEVQDWDATLGRELDGVRVAAVVERRRVDPLITALEKDGSKVKSVVPALAVTMRALGKSSVPQGRRFVVAIESDEATVLAYEGVRLCGIAQHRCGTAGLRPLAAALKREAVLLGWSGLPEAVIWGVAGRAVASDTADVLGVPPDLRSYDAAAPSARDAMARFLVQ